MRFILVGETAKIGAHIKNCGGQVVKTYTNGEEVALSNPNIEFPEADYLLNCFSPVILKAHILDRFKNRALNVHNGKLPEYSGIHVHQWAIRNGETETAVMVHQMTSEIDSGDIVAERSVKITAHDTGFSLFHKTLKESIALMSDVVDMTLSGKELLTYPQNTGKRKIYRHKDALNSKIDWSKPADEVRNFIRAGSYFPFQSPTYTATIPSECFGGILILKANVVDSVGTPGSILELEDGEPTIACGEMALRITRVRTASGLEVDWTKVF